ncbi:Stromal cell-derived factor 2-like protein 1 [Chytridiales sp. JEL 0842]|nr:Stromal cell-derived factor 2-like protein 1 [Chytridiales sp. JEL 0842]
MKFFMLSTIPLIWATLAAVSYASATDFVIEQEFEKVTCGSAVKLTHASSGYKIHSHGINYGDSYFIVHKSVNDPYCPRGTTVKCGEIVRLEHMNTKKFLHSHQHMSPMSQQQEVSAYGNSDEGDHWKVICLDKKDTHWKRESKIRLQHSLTSKYLSSNAKYQFRNPIPGQLEVAASKSSGTNEVFMVQEGIFYAEKEKA